MNYRHLISENDEDISTGRVAFWICFAVLIWFWIRIGLGSAIDVPESLWYSFFALLGYNMGKKFKPKLSKSDVLLQEDQ